MLINVLSANIGSRRPITAKNGVTGIFKTPVAEAVQVTAEGLAGDVICDRNHHGGVDQAVYVYCQLDYEWWQRHHDIAICPGLFGENLTVSGMSTTHAHIGARLVAENVTLEITSPRTPCDTFAARMNDKTFPKRFWASRLTGFYCRVIEEGTIKVGDSMQFEPYAGIQISIDEWIARSPLQNLDQAARKRFLSVPVHYKTREELSQ